MSYCKEILTSVCMDLQSVQQGREAITDYMKFYNTKRKHQSLDYLVPEIVYQQGLII
jgi:hypothetical protein